MPVQRIDEDDEFYKNITDKFAAIAKEIRERQEKGQPVLVGTVSIEKSEMLSEYLDKEGIQHEVLNARFHEQEAHIVAQAGRLGAVTIATNMAGRGTDIQLGGNLEFRIEDELERDARGAGARRGDRRASPTRSTSREGSRCSTPAACSCSAPSATRAAASTTSCAAARAARAIPACRASTSASTTICCASSARRPMFARLMNKNLEDGEAIVSPWISKAIETAQKKVEARNYDIRKQVVEYDDVMNDQRKVIYEQRADIMDAETVDDVVEDMRAETVNAIVGEACPPGTYPEQWDVEGLKEQHRRDASASQPPIDDWLEEEAVEPEMHRRAAPGSWPTTQMAEQDRRGRPGALDRGREEHPAPDARPSLEGASRDARCAAPGHPPARYAQKKPIDEYKQEAFAAVRAAAGRDPRGRHPDAGARAGHQFEPMPPTCRSCPTSSPTISIRCPATTTRADIDAGTGAILSRLPPLQMPQAADAGSDDRLGELRAPVSRNAPCPCGSGRKYKHCHGQLA